jgi:hypothetical protein
MSQFNLDQTLTPSESAYLNTLTNTNTTSIPVTQTAGTVPTSSSPVSPAYNVTLSSLTNTANIKSTLLNSLTLPKSSGSINIVA